MWIEIPPPGVPRHFKNEIPIYEVVKSYLLIHKKESLKVERVFALSSGEFLRIYYNGPKFLEELMIENRDIIYASAKSVEKMVDIPPFNLPEEEFFKRFQEFFSQSKAIINPPTYHNIKRFEKELRLLPWQEDFSAVYVGKGIFIE